MNTRTLPLVIAALCLFLSTQLFGQTAKVQIIHNSADVAAATVDIYLDGGMTPAIDDFAFRSATGFIDLPTSVDVGIAPGNSTGPSDIIATFPFSLMANETYVVLATGVLDPMMYDTTTNGASAIAFDLKVLTPADTSATMGSIALAAAHGAPDAPTVDVLANGGVLIDSLVYGTSQGYLTVPAAEYVLDVTPEADNSTIVASYYVDLSPLSGSAAVVFASGFLDPTMNQNGQAFGLFAALPSGDVVELGTIGSARAQVIHNAADPGAATVDVYVNTIKDTIKVDNFAFRTATPFLSLPTGYEVEIVIAGPTSTDISDQVVATFPATLMADESYTIVANGVLDTASFAANPDGINTSFGLFIGTGAQETSADPANVDLRVFHGATDAPTVDVLANGATPPAVSNLAYTDFTAGYLALPPASYDLSVTPAGMNSSVVATFTADASTLAGGAGVILASGFLDPSMNQSGAGFELILALANGEVIVLPLATGLQDLIEKNDLLSLYPNPASSSLNITYAADVPGTVELRIMDLAGRTLVQEQFEGRSTQEYQLNMDVSQFSAGIYSVLVTTEQSRSVQRLVITK